MAGIPTESPLVLRESLGSSHNRLTSAEDDEEALLSGYPPVGLLDAKNIYHAEKKAIAYPGLNAGACAHHGVIWHLRRDRVTWPCSRRGTTCAWCHAVRSSCRWVRSSQGNAR